MLSTLYPIQQSQNLINMSSTDNEIALTSGKDDFPLSHLIAALENNQGLVHVDVGQTFSKASPDTSVVASDADWKKFWAAVAQINAPVTSLIEPVEPSSHVHGRQERVSPGTVIAAIEVAITIAQTLWNFFSGWDDKDVWFAFVP